MPFLFKLRWSSGFERSLRKAYRNQHLKANLKLVVSIRAQQIFALLNHRYLRKSSKNRVGRNERCS